MMTHPSSRPGVRPARAPCAFTAALVCLLAYGLAGCAVTHVDPPPAPAVPAQFKETGPGGPWQRAAAAQTAPAVPDAWWRLFGDPALDELEQRLLIGNENLKAALAQVESARAVLRASRWALLPTLSAGLSADRSRNPSFSGGNTGTGTGIGTNSGTNNANDAGSARNSFSLSADASWEIDLWGRLSEAVAGARANLQASSDDLAAARLSAQSLLAQTYFSLRLTEAQQALLERSLQVDRRAQALAQARYDSGVAARNDVLQAETQVQNVQVQAAEAALQRTQLEHAIAVLLGLPPAALSLPATGMLPAAPGVPPTLPSTVLERRPDLAAAERRVAAAYAQIGIADAAFFPSLTLSASAGYSHSALSDLVRAPNLFWSLGTSLAEAVLDGGQRELASAQARANAEAATATYRQAVLTALQEVEDNLAAARQLEAEADLQAQALASARRNLEITLDQYRAGTVSYLEVSVAQTSALSGEITWLQVRARQLAAINLLLKNIAGRWA